MRRPCTFLLLLSFPVTTEAWAVAGWTAYRTLLVERPVVTKAATSSVIMTLSDALTQHLEARLAVQQVPSTSASSRPSLIAKSPNSLDNNRCRHSWSRSRQSMLTGLIWSGPVAHYWYQLLEFAIDSVLKLPSAPVLQLIGRIALDAILFSPFTIAGFFAVSTLLERGTLGDVMDKLRTRWRRALVAAWSFWPVVNIVNFGIIPLAYRVLYANVMSLLWTGYLSYVNNLKQYKPTLTGKVS